MGLVEWHNGRWIENDVSVTKYLTIIHCQADTIGVFPFLGSSGSLSGKVGHWQSGTTDQELGTLALRIARSLQCRNFVENEACFGVAQRDKKT